jgi:hypothetical protein
MLDVGAESSRLLGSLAEKAPSQGALPLDPGDPRQAELIAEVLTAAGRGPDRYPALHAALKDGGKGADPDADHCTIIDAGKDSQGRATARGWLASRGTAFISGAVTMAVDADSGKVLAAGSATQVGGTLVQAATVSAEAGGAPEKLTAVTLFHAQTTPDTPPRFGLVARTAETVTGDIRANVVAPQPIKLHGQTTLIGLCRDREHMGNVDYAYVDNGNSDPDRLAVPFTGTAPIAEGVDTSRPITVTTQIYVMAAKAYLAPLRGFPLTGQSGSGYTVSFDYPFDGKPVNQTASIQYEANAQANNNNPSAFFFQFTVPIQGLGNPTVTFTVCSRDYPEEPSINCTVIPDLQFWWHCLGEDTTVLLADGGTAPIDAINNDNRVVSGIGDATPQVTATTRAYHDDNGGRDPMLRLKTEGGLSLLLSSHHPVITPERGPVAAEDLQAGDTVLTADGAQSIAGIEPEDYNNQLVFNLQVPRDDGEIGTFVANGIIVGDVDAMTAHDDRMRHDADYNLPRIPEEQQKDWLSAVEDAQAAAAR